MRGVVQVIQKCLPRNYDWCARLGGGEFAVVLPQTNLVGIVSVTVSIGVSGLQAMPNRDTVTVETLAETASPSRD